MTSKGIIKAFPYTYKAEDLQPGMRTEFGTLVKVVDEGEVMFLETKTIQFDIRKGQPVRLY